jgi:cell division protein FtsX
MKVVLVIVFVILLLLANFCLWVLAKISSRASEMEEQMEIERKLRK